jgi:hypothetical protein
VPASEFYRRTCPLPDDGRAHAAAAIRWLTEVYQPTIAAIPTHLRSRLDAAEIFHEILEHRWLLSEATGRDVGMQVAVRDYVERVLSAVPGGLVTPTPPIADRGFFPPSSSAAAAWARMSSGTG